MLREEGRESVVYCSFLDSFHPSLMFIVIATSSISSCMNFQITRKCKFHILVIINFVLGLPVPVLHAMNKVQVSRFQQDLCRDSTTVT